ncbi:MAG: DUF1559 domain-containing protein, partial [Planctomycetales bacterium]|nr:DUF1559 domain-containing protein [Planctomycetales bacterium]
MVGPRNADFVDGQKHSILVIESGPDKAVAWTKPDDLVFNPSDPLAALGDISSGQIRAVMADGRLLTAASTIDPATFKALVTIGGSEIIDVDTLRREYAEQHGGVGAVTTLTRSEGDARFREVALAFHNYHDTYARLPIIADPDYFDANGNPLVSWRVHLLPFLGYSELYNAFNLEEAWNSPTNLPLLAQMPDIFRSAEDASDGTTTRIMTFNGSEAAFGSKAAGADQTGPKFSDLKDGPANTILFVEASSENAVPWTKPDDLAFDLSDPFSTLGSLTSGEIRLALADGTQAKLAADVGPRRLAALVTPDGDASAL